MDADVKVKKVQLQEEIVDDTLKDPVSPRCGPTNTMSPISYESINSCVLNSGAGKEIMALADMCDDEGLPTATSEAQKEVEKSVSQFYSCLERMSRLDLYEDLTQLKKDRHVTYILASLHGLPRGYEKMDASRAWFCYWLLHSLDLLSHELDSRTAEKIINLLISFQDPNTGGYGGGPYQYGHLATTYAAVNSIVLLGTPAAFASVNRLAIATFLGTLRVGDGSFHIQIGGESDVRAVYCAVVVARILNITSANLFKDTIDWLLLCQTYEGGFGGEPGLEAHGGFTFCAVAALFLLNGLHRCDLNALLRWAVNRQMRYEGGFQGRTNKLVDSCYSFWLSGIIAITHSVLFKENKELASWLFDPTMLQQYVLVCCQHKSGGLVDKPSVDKDAYHTCYALSGLSIAQNQPSHLNNTTLGNAKENSLNVVHPAFNLPIERLVAAMDHFNSLPPVTTQN